MTIREQLARDEGSSLKAYRDSEGLLTIGIGHCLDADVALRDALAAKFGGDPDAIEITEEECLRLFENDLAVAEDAVRAAFPWSWALSACRRAVLIEMVFNMGLGTATSGLRSFKRFLAAAEAGDYTTAAKEMRASTWAAQVKDRAKRLARQMETDDWQ
jgi:lysozyme